MIFHPIQPYGVSIAEPINQAYGIEFFWHWFKKTFNPSKTSDANDKGFDGGKKIKGRKRHIAVDTLVNLLSVMVHAANIHDTKAGIFVAKKAFETYPSLKGFCADAGYRNTFEREVSEQLGLTVEISKKIQDISWHILPKRWIVERTFAWLGWSGRLAKDFEQTNLSAENFVKLRYISQILKFIK